MIKVFLVEDEYAIREGIKKSVDWEKDGFELVGEAGDGEVAFPKILKSKPDILITDIRMPFMDGLELSKLVKKELPGIRIVVLSGYDDFNYAKEAISIGVEEYMLKPVSGDNLMKELKRIAETIISERQEEEVRQKYLKEREEIRVLAQQKFLHDIIDGKLSIQTSLNTGRELGIDITAAYYSTTLMQIFPRNISSIEIDEYSGVKEEIYSQIKSRYSNLENVYLYQQVGDVLCFLEKADSADEMHSNITSRIESIAELMENYPEMLYFISVGKPVERIRDVNISYADASKKFAERYMLEESYVFYEDMEGTSRIKEDIRAERLENRESINNLDIQSIDVSIVAKKSIYSFMKQGTITEIDDLVEEYFSSMGEEAVESVMLRQYVLVESLLSAIALLESVGLSREDASQILGELTDPVRYNTSVEAAREYVRSLLHVMIEYRNQLSDKKYSGIIGKAKKYIQENYQNEEMSLQSVASNVNVSSNHFSAIFRKETGETFIDYLTEVRMEKAKDLLVSTSMKTSEVGYEVGYRDPHYFSYIFKKTQGVSPKEYRKARKEN